MKKALLSILSPLFLLFLLPLIVPSPAHAQSPSRGFWETQLITIGGSITGISMDSELGGIICSDEMSQEKYIIGCTPSANGKQAVSGILPTLSNYVAIALIRQPVSSLEYIADLGDSIGLPQISKAQAQGIGYRELSPILGIWKGFRNAAYSLYIIVFAIVGLMIVFRTKINAQTVITIQSALPNLLITLVLITFSYAIAGFMVDLIYFSIYFIVYLAGAANLLVPQDTIDRLLTNNLFTIIFSDKNNILSISSSAIAKITTDALGGSQLAGIASGVLSKPLAWVIIGIALLFAILKTLLELIKSYINIIILTISAPLALLGNALPGSQSFMNWLKRLLANAAVFPVITAMILLGAILAGPATQQLSGTNDNPYGVTPGTGYLQDGGGSGWIPPYLGFIASEKGDDFQTADLYNTFMALIGLGIILMMPKAAEMARDALQVKTSPYTSSIGEALSFGATPAKGIPSVIRGRRARKQEEKRHQELLSALGRRGGTP